MRGTGPRHAPRVPFALLVTGIVVGGLCLFLVLNTASAANELDRHDLAGKDAAISAKLEQLRNEVAASAAPEALASAAAQLGMVPAGNPAFLVIGADGAVRVLGSAAAASAPATPHPTKSKSKTKSMTKSKTPANTTTNTNTATPTKTDTSTSTNTKTANTSVPNTASTSSSTPARPASPTTSRTPTTRLGGGAR